MGLKAVATLVAGGGPPVGGSGTIGKIPKWATTTTLGDSVITESGGNVGIGTSSPGRLLTASVSNAGGTINTGTAVVRVVNASHASADNRFCGVHFAHTDADAQVTGAIGTVLTSTAVAWAGDMVFGVKSSATASVLTEYMRIQAGGNVGIGTTSPASALDVAGTITCDDVSTGIKLPASPGNADVQTLDCYQESTYTATDTSGAGLVFPVNNAAVCTRVGRLVFVRVDITYPVTADTSYASLSVPFTSIVAGGTAAAYCGVLGTCLILANVNAFEVYASVPLTRQTNAGLSGVRLVFAICFQAS